MSLALKNVGGHGRDGFLAEDKGASTLAAIWVVTGIAIVFTMGRLWVRGYMQRRLRSDDYFTIFSMVNSIVACGLATKAVSRGLGRHLEALSPEDQSAATVWTFAAFFPSLVSFAVPKLAVISLLTRLLLPSRPHLWFLWFMGTFVQLAQVGSMVLLSRDLVNKCTLLDYNIACVPMRTQVKYYVFAGSLSTFADFYLAAYPSAVLYQLQMPRKKKFALSVALGCGVVSGAVAAYKTTRIPLLLDPDFTYANAELQLWTLVEGGIIVIASSIPVLQPLMDKIFGVALMARPRAYFNNYNAMFSDRRKIATQIRKRIRDYRGTTTTDFDMETVTRPEEVPAVHIIDSGIDGRAYNDPRHGDAEDGCRIRGDPRPAIYERILPKA